MAICSSCSSFGPPRPSSPFKKFASGALVAALPDAGRTDYWGGSMKLVSDDIGWFTEIVCDASITPVFTSLRR